LLVIGPGFTQFLRALIAADLNDALANFDFNGSRIELAIAGCAGFLTHDTSPFFGPPVGQG
jgi:hypothetical protein